LFFFTDPPPPQIYPLSLHDALPICSAGLCNPQSVPLKRDLDPEANGTVAAIEQLRITKAGRQSVQASVEIDERIDSAKGRRRIGSGKVVTVIRVVEDVHHAHVPGNTGPLSPLSHLGNLEVAGVGYSVPHLVAADIAERRTKNRIRFGAIEDVSNLAGTDRVHGDGGSTVGDGCIIRRVVD